MKSPCDRFNHCNEVPGGQSMSHNPPPKPFDLVADVGSKEVHTEEVQALRVHLHHSHRKLSCSTEAIRPVCLLLLCADQPWK